MTVTYIKIDVIISVDDVLNVYGYREWYTRQNKSIR